MADLGVFGGWIITSMGTGRVSEQGQAKASQDGEGGGSLVLNIAGDAILCQRDIGLFRVTTYVQVSIVRLTLLGISKIGLLSPEDPWPKANTRLAQVLKWW